MDKIAIKSDKELEKVEPKVLACLYVLQLPLNKIPDYNEAAQYAKTHTFIGYNTLSNLLNGGITVIDHNNLELDKEDFRYALKYYAKNDRIRKIANDKFVNIQPDIWANNLVTEHFNVLKNLDREIEDLKTRVVTHEFLKSELFKAIKSKDILDSFCSLNFNNTEKYIGEYRKFDTDDIEKTTSGKSNSKEHGIYKIAKDNWGAVSKGLERCKDILGEEFSYKIIGEDIVDQDNNRTYYDGDYYEELLHSKIPVYIVEINCKVKVQEWEVAAIVKHTEGQNGVIVTPINKDLEVPEKYNYITKIDCDHCHAPRKRNLGFIVYNHNTKEYKIVGSDCLNVYTKINPSGLLALNNVFNEIESTVIDVKRGKTVYDVNETLITAQAAIALYGYKKADINEYGGSEDFNVESTKERVRYILDSRLFSTLVEDARSSRANPSTKTLLAVLKSIIKYREDNRDELDKKAKEIKEFYKNLDTTKDLFQQKLKVALSGWTIPKEQIGLVTCIPHLYAKTKQKEAEIAAKNASLAKDGIELTNSQPVGNSNLGGNVTDWDNTTRCDIKITKDAIYKIIIGENKTTYGSYPVTIYVRGNDGDNNKCGRIQTFVNDRFDPDEIEMITGKANGVNYFRDTYSGKLSYPKFWTKEMVDSASSSSQNNVAKYKEKERITIEVEEVSRSELYASGYGYNYADEYAILTIKDKNGDTFKWSCTTSLIYHPNDLIGKKLKATVKQIKKDAFGNILMYIITRGTILG